MAAVRRHLWPAFGLAGITIGLFVGTIVLGTIANHKDAGGGGGYVGIGYVVASIVVGLVVAAHQPKNPIGWLMVGFPTAIGAFLFAQQVAIATYRHHPLVAVLCTVAVQVFYYAFILTAPLILLFFPDGRLPSPRWRWVLRAYLALGAGNALIPLVWGAVIAQRGHWHITSVTGSPTIAGPPAFVNIVSVVLLLGCLAMVLAWVVRRIGSYRHATPAVRQQYKWLAIGGVGLVMALVLSFITPTSSNHSAWGHIVSILSAVLALPFPVTVGVAILRYRLYDINRVISRTVSYALLTALLVGLYAGMVTLVTHVLPSSSSVAVAASTLVAAALFNPLRRRLQRLVDRRFNRARYDAEATVAEFSDRLRAAVELGAVQDDLVAAVSRTLEPSSVSVWLRAGASGVSTQPNANA
jgi:MFS family permease